jgi:hypothetical protein
MTIGAEHCSHETMNFLVLPRLIKPEMASQTGHNNILFQAYSPQIINSLQTSWFPWEFEKETIPAPCNSGWRNKIHWTFNSKRPGWILLLDRYFSFLLSVPQWVIPDLHPTNLYEADFSNVHAGDNISINLEILQHLILLDSVSVWLNSNSSMNWHI